VKWHQINLDMLVGFQVESSLASASNSAGLKRLKFFCDPNGTNVRYEVWNFPVDNTFTMQGYKTLEEAITAYNRIEI
jgi:hypothetical protein